MHDLPRRLRAGRRGLAHLPPSASPVPDGWIHAPDLWQSAAHVEEIFQRKKRRRPFARVGGVFFAILAVVSLADAIRSAPLPFGASVLEAIAYRLAATTFCAAMAFWLLLPRREGRAGDGERLLR